MAAGNQPSLAAAAALDLKGIDGQADPLALAERWYEEAQKLEIPYRYGALLRARHWYEGVLADDPGIQKPWQPRLEQAFLAELALRPLQWGTVTEGNVASQRMGAQVVGPGTGLGLIDGVIPPLVTGQGMAVGRWPCEWTILLPSIYRLREIRVKLPDPGKSVQYFVLSVSADGKNFQIVADHSKLPSAGWQRFVFLAKPVRAIRLQGVTHTGDESFYVSELEAYCTAPAPWILQMPQPGDPSLRRRRTGPGTAPQAAPPRAGPANPRASSPGPVGRARPANWTIRWATPLLSLRPRP